MKRAIACYLFLSVLDCAVLFSQGYVWNPFTKRLDKVGAGGGGPGAAYSTVQDEGAAIAQQPSLNFVGAGVSCVDDAINGRTNCSIAGGGAGGGLNSFVGSLPIITGGTLTDPTVKFGYSFGSTVTTATYTVVAGDNGTVKRFANGTGIAVTLPLMTYPFTMMLFNDGVGPVIITASTGEINNDGSLTLMSQEGALLSLNQSSAFWRGITVTGRVQSGAGAPAANRCNQIEEAGQIYMRTDAAATAASLYTCINNGVGTYAWEGPFNPSGGGGSGGGSTSFVPTIDTTTETVSLSAGTLRVGNFTCAVNVGGFQVTGSGTGLVVYYIDNQCQPTVMAPAGVATSLLGTTIRATSATPSVPYGSFPLGIYQATAGDLVQTTLTRTEIGLSPVLFSSKFSTTDNNGTRNVDLAANAFTVSLEKSWNFCAVGATGTAASILWAPSTAGTDTDGVAVAQTGTDPWKICNATFTDTENQFMNFAWVIPPNWAGGTVQAKLVWRSSSGSAGSAYMRLYNKAIAPSTTDVATTGPTFTTVDDFTGMTVTTSLFDMVGTVAAITTTGWAAGNIVYFQLKRERSNALDTMDADTVNASQIQLIYSTNVNQ